MMNSSTFTRAMDELQTAMFVVPSQVYDLPRFTDIRTLPAGRFREALVRRIGRDVAFREIARCSLSRAGMMRGELARVTGLSDPEAGLGNRALVTEGFATVPAPGTSQLASRRVP